MVIKWVWMWMRVMMWYIRLIFWWIVMICCVWKGFCVCWMCFEGWRRRRRFERASRRAGRGSGWWWSWVWCWLDCLLCVWYFEGWSLLRSDMRVLLICRISCIRIFVDVEVWWRSGRTIWGRLRGCLFMKCSCWKRLSLCCWSRRSCLMFEI